MKPYTSPKDYGQSASGDMSRVKSSADGKGKPEKTGASQPLEQPGKPASGEMGKVKKVADICPTGTDR